MGAPDADLKALAVRAAAGDRGALRRIWELTADRLVREVIAPIAPDRATCEDVLRDTFLVVLERLPSLCQGEVFPWLATIARNKSIDARRRLSAVGRFQAALARELAAVAEDSPGVDATAAALEERREARERVEAVLAGMNARYAHTLRLRLLEDQPREACAQQMDVKLGTFDVLFFRACKQFKALYVEKYGTKVEVQS